MKSISISKKVSLFGILGALTLVLSLADNLIFSSGVAGMRLGLSNIALVAAATISPIGGLYVMAIKVSFALITRGATAGLMSLCGSLISTVATVALITLRKRSCRFRRFMSFVGISVISAALHNLGQLLCACALSGTFALFGYGKFMLVFALVSGSITGLALNIILPRIGKVINL